MKVLFVIPEVEFLGIEFISSILIVNYYSDIKNRVDYNQGMSLFAAKLQIIRCSFVVVCNKL